MKYYAKHPKVSGWGATYGARVVSHLTKEERELVRAGCELYISNCPQWRGCTDRVIIEYNGRFYTRMPAWVMAESPRAEK